jgi:uncharacterized membrane protein
LRSDMSSIAEAIFEALNGLPWWGKWLSTIAISMLPIVELRGALPAAVKVFHIDWGLAYLLAVFGNMVPVPFLLMFYPAVERFLRRFSFMARFFDRLNARAKRKGKNKVKLWGELGLVFFVAIPLPVTGAWTGTLIAYLFDLNRFRAFFAILAGVLIAGLIMMAVTFFNIWIGIGIILLLAGLLFMTGRLEKFLMGE